jgi:hypothetical protein
LKIISKDRKKRVGTVSTYSQVGEEIRLYKVDILAGCLKGSDHNWRARESRPSFPQLLFLVLK